MSSPFNIFVFLIFCFLPFRGIVAQNPTEVSIEYHGVIDGAYLFFIENKSADTIEVTKPSYLYEYSRHCKCFLVEDYGKSQNEISFYLGWMDESADYIADGDQENYIFSNSSIGIAPNTTYGYRIKPYGLRIKKLKNFIIDLKVEVLIDDHIFVVSVNH